MVDGRVTERTSFEGWRKCAAATPNQLSNYLAGCMRDQQLVIAPHPRCLVQNLQNWHLDGLGAYLILLTIFIHSLHKDMVSVTAAF